MGGSVKHRKVRSLIIFVSSLIICAKKKAGAAKKVRTFICLLCIIPCHFDLSGKDWLKLSTLRKASVGHKNV